MRKPKGVTDEEWARSHLTRHTVKGSPDECWLWTGTATWTNAKRIYRPAMSFRKQKSAVAARVLWELERGAIPDGLFVCHTCDNAMCMNLNHLYLGTALRNIADRVLRRRSPTVLNEEIVRKIVNLRGQGFLRREIVKLTGVKTFNVQNILRGHCWTHITGIEPHKHRPGKQRITSILSPKSQTNGETEQEKET